jgi:predicted membrane-bound spermidine synthase
LGSPKILVYLFFFLSGIPALVYQLIWQRALFRVFGVNIESVTIVVTAFMLGLGVGSLIGSWFVGRRSLSPLLLIGVIELSIALFGLSSLSLFDLADQFVQSISLPAKALVALGLVFFPTSLMGMTLPLLVGYLIRRSANVGLSTGTLYCVNTLGAVLGCISASLVLFPLLGLQHSVWVAAGLNLFVGIAALIAFQSQRAAEAMPASSSSGSHENLQSSLKSILSWPTSVGLAFLGGFVSLSYEIYLFRLASFASATSAPTLAIMLAAFLLGVAFGARLAADWCDDFNLSARGSASATRLLLASSLVGLLMLPVLSISWRLGNGVLAVIILFAFFLAFSLGVIFPLLAHFAIAPDKNSGRRVGLLYGANILGSTFGSLLTGFVLSDFFGARALAVFLSMLTFAIASFFFWESPRSAKRLRTYFVSAFLVAAILIAFQGSLTAGLMESLLYKSEVNHALPLTNVVENRDGIIAVSTDGTVYGGGAYDGRFNTNPIYDTNGIIRPFGLSLYHPRLDKVLMIGLSSGSWAQVIANNPDVAHLTIVEINPGYISLIQQRPEVASLLKNHKVRIIFDDGRRWLKQHPESLFDAIVANTTYHFRSNASNVLSVEFNSLIRAHLKSGGIYLFNTTDSKRVARTGCESFRHGYRVLNNLLLSDSPISLAVDHWRRVLLNYNIDGHRVFDLRRREDAIAYERILNLPVGADSKAPGSEGNLMETCSNILARTVGTQVVTDDNMGTEWRHSLGLE